MTATHKARAFHHTVASVHFPPGEEDGPAVCECGWMGLASEHAGHRRDNGATKHLRWRANEDTPAWNRTLNPEALGKRQAEAEAAA